MAAVAPAPAAPATPADQAVDLLQKLQLESQSKKEDGADAAKKPSVLTFAHSNGGNTQGLPFHADRSFSPGLPDSVDPNFYMYPPYYFGGYDSSVSEWDTRYANRDGMEVPMSVYGGDMYHAGYGFPPYPYSSPPSPAPSVGHDGQLYGPQHYQYPTSYYQPQVASHTPSQAPSQSELSTSVASEHVSVDATKTNANGLVNGNSSVLNGSAALKQTQQNSSISSNGGRSSLPGGYSAASYQDPRYGYGGVRSPLPWSDGPMYSSAHQRSSNGSISSPLSYGANSLARSQNQRSSSYVLGTQRPSSVIGSSTAGYLNRMSMYPNTRLYSQYGQYGNALKAGLGFSPSAYSSRGNSRWGLVVDNKYKPRGRGSVLYGGFGSENQDGFSELNRGPRAGSFKNQKPLGSNITIAVKGQALPSIGKQETNIAADKEHLNREDFPVTYKDAKFYVIKSYSEDDVHKSIKYNVWASTPSGNKKLDAGYREAQEKEGGCPVFLFFSVNTSGQFVGVAEMDSPVDFNKTVEYWQQDKWNGCFSVKWHIVKDVPNSLLKHITLENNDNKPVTNSRDTQEVKLEQGLELLKIFKEHSSKTSILDDFLFYENRQKLMQEKRAKNQQLAQVWDTKTDALSGERDKSKIQLSLDPAALHIKEAANGNGDRKLLEENAAVSISEAKISKPASEMQSVAAGLANTN